MASGGQLAALDAVWVGGANTALDPRLPEGQFVRGTNVVIRGGIPRTRPGSRFLFNLPGENVQALASYDPVFGTPSLVVVVDGYVYLSEYPFRRLRRLPNLRMSVSAPKVWVSEAVQYVAKNEDGSLAFIAPKKVLIFQDGLGAAGYYDGYHSGKVGGLVDSIPQGTAMAWSGNRLWVASGNRIYASDFGNPFSFVEQYYLGGNDSLVLPGNVTGLTEVPNAGGDTPFLMAFTADATFAIQSFLPRESWPTTNGFLRTMFPDVGCVSASSIVNQFGNLWWFSRSGLVNFNLAHQSQVSSAFTTADSEMLHYKASLSPGKDKVAAVGFENLLLVSIPGEAARNRRTMVLDSSVVQGQSAWAGIWTGFEPVEWAKLTIHGAERLYVATVDDDGNAQLLEFFSGHRTDSGQDIECSVELRAHTGGTVGLKEFQFADLTFSDVEGTVDFRVDWRGFSRGAWKPCMAFRAKVGRGSFRADRPVSAETTVVQAFIGQMRRLRTQNNGYVNEITVTSGSRETDIPERADWAFSFLIRWNGRAALREFTPQMKLVVERTTGKCASDETEESFTRFDGASAGAIEDLEDADNRVEIFEGTASYTGSWVDTTEVSATKSARSLISQQAADKMALQAAQAQVAYSLELLAEPVISEA